MNPDSIVAKVEAVLEKLATLSGSISDRFNSTHDILITLSNFAQSGLDDLTNDIEEIRDEVETIEEENTNLKEELSNES